MDYALLPFPTLSRTVEYEGRPDIRHALASRQRTVARYAIDNLDLLENVVESLRDLPWHFHIGHCHEEDGQLHLAVVAVDLGRNLDVGDKLNAGFYHSAICPRRDSSPMTNNATFKPLSLTPRISRCTA